MSNYPFFYNSVSGDRVYDADSFSDWLKRFFTTGVFNGEFLVTEGGGMTVAVSGGYVNIGGKVQTFDPTTLTLSAASSNLYRRDAIVVERNDTDRDFYLKVVAGTNASSEAAAAAPAPVRTTTVQQIVVAHILVAPGATAIHQPDITDTRFDADICGIVAGTVDQMDFSGFEAQFQDWFDNVKDTLSDDAAGHLLALIEATNAEIGDTPMGTEATTLTGAIAEHEGKLEEQQSDIESVSGDLSKITSNYPTQTGMKGAPAIWTLETNSCKYMGFAVNPTTKELYVYGSNNPANLPYIGRIQLI